jgi:hypothetical protein
MYGFSINTAIVLQPQKLRSKVYKCPWFGFTLLALRPIL